MVRTEELERLSVVPDNLESFVADAVSLITEFQWLTEQSLTGFFCECEEIWDKDDAWPMERSWKEALAALSLDECSELPAGLRKAEWPQSLVEFLDRAQACSLRREHDRSDAEADKTLAEVRVAIHDQLRYMKGMSEKKLHEVEVLAGVVDCTARGSGSQTVIDIGAGAGYLSHVLQLSCGLRVVGLEGNPSHTQAAVARQEQLGKRLARAGGRQVDGKEEGGVEIMTCFLDFKSPTLSEDFLCKLPWNEAGGRVDGGESSAERRHPPLCVTGLHCCGDLTPATIELFAQCEDVRSLAIVGCCYHRISTVQTRSASATPPFGFPMSQLVPNVSSTGGPPPMTMLTLELGTHCGERWRARSQHMKERNVKSLCFRAVLESVVRPLVPAHHQVILRKHGCNDSAFVSFDAYLDRVLAKVHIRETTDGWSMEGKPPLLPLPLDNNEELRPKLLEAFDRLQHRFTALNALQALKLALQPVIESLLLVDRVAYLREKLPSCSVMLVPVFDPMVSPRNTALIATK